jgi:hypothetical protein
MHIPLLQIGARHMASLLVAMIRGQDGSHLSRCRASASTTSMVKALEEILADVLHLPTAKWSRPQQSVAGGRQPHLIVGGEDPGLDCFVDVYF